MKNDKEVGTRILKLLPEAKQEILNRSALFENVFLMAMSEKLDELGEKEFKKQGPDLLQGLIAEGEANGFI